MPISPYKDYAVLYSVNKAGLRHAFETTSLLIRSIKYKLQ